MLDVVIVCLISDSQQLYKVFLYSVILLPNKVCNASLILVIILLNIFTHNLKDDDKLIVNHMKLSVYKVICQVFNIRMVSAQSARYFFFSKM